MPLYGSIWISIWISVWTWILILIWTKNPANPASVPCVSIELLKHIMSCDFLLHKYAFGLKFASQATTLRGRLEGGFIKNTGCLSRGTPQKRVRERVPDRVPLSSEVRTLNARRMLREQVWNPYPRPWLWESHTWSNMHTLLQWARTHADSIYIL